MLNVSVYSLYRYYKNYAKFQDLALKRRREIFFEIDPWTPCRQRGLCYGDPFKVPHIKGKCQQNDI